MTQISIAIPVYNEAENITPLLDRLLPVLARDAVSFEVIFVDDGSRDGSVEQLDLASRCDQRIKIIHFSRNFGHQAALQAGLDVAVGDAVVLMDGDLQDPPEVIEDFLRRWKEGFDVVYAVRERRKEGLFKRAAYKTFYRTLRAIADIDVPLDAGDFCLLDRRVVDILVSLPERGRFLRGLRSWVGFRQIGVSYERSSRHGGHPKYTVRRLFRLAIAGYVGFSSMPLRIASWLGFIAAGGGFVLLFWAIITRLAGIPTPAGWASTIGVTLFVGGAQLLVLGVIGEYLGRMYDEVRGRPLYVVGSRVGFDSAQVTAARSLREEAAHSVRLTPP